LEWDPINLATAELRSLSLYRNGAKAGSIPRPSEITSTKISGLAIDTEYTFQLVLRTSAGTYSSSKLEVRTHKMTDLSGITVTPGVLPAQLRQSLATAVERIGGKLVDAVRIDTTHFVCTEGRGREWERAVEMNIPVVRPEWIEGCEREGRIVGVRGYYLNADPRLRQVGQGVNVGNQQGHSRRNESVSSVKRGPPSSVATDRRGSTAISATSSPSGAGSRTPQTYVEPPTPPAKDARNSSQPPPSSSASTTSVNEEGEEAGEQRKEAKVRSPHGSRSLVQSPFDSAHKDNLAYRTANSSAAASSERVDSPDGRPSEGGTFSEVAL
jgi:chitin biosynthesis protein CHS5